MCTAAKNCRKVNINPFFGGGSRSFKVIDVDKYKEPVTSLCYDMQHVCLSATVFSPKEPIAAK